MHTEDQVLEEIQDLEREVEESKIALEDKDKLIKDKDIQLIEMEKLILNLKNQINNKL